MIAFAADTDTQAPPNQVTISGMAAGIEQQAPALVLVADVAEAPTLVAAAGANEPYQIAAAPAKPASRPAPTGPSMSQKIGWGLVGAVVANLATGGISGMAWAFHALVTGAGGYVGATTVAEKMK